MAVPVFAQTRSDFSMDLMAFVGQTFPHSWHLGSQKPRRGVTAGENKEGKPAENQMGCRVFVGHATMHSPHLTHLDKKSVSIIAPGGLTSPLAPTWPSPGFPYNELSPVKDIIAVPAPTIPVDTNARLFGEKDSHPIVSFFDDSKVTAFSGHISSQVLQTIHSEKNVRSGFSISIADMGHFRAHLPHWLQR